MSGCPIGVRALQAQEIQKQYWPVDASVRCFGALFEDYPTHCVPLLLLRLLCHHSDWLWQYVFALMLLTY